MPRRRAPQPHSTAATTWFRQEARSGASPTRLRSLLMRAYARRLAPCARRSRRSHEEETDDLVHGMFACKLEERFPQGWLGSGLGLQAWLEVQVTHYAKDRHKHHLRRRTSPLPDALPSRGPRPPAAYLANQRSQLLVEALLLARRNCHATGNALAWDLFEGRHYDRRSFLDLAALHGITAVRARARVDAAKRMLRKALYHLLSKEGVPRHYLHRAATEMLEPEST